MQVFGIFPLKIQIETSKFKIQIFEIQSPNFRNPKSKFSKFSDEAEIFDNFVENLNYQKIKIFEYFTENLKFSKISKQIEIFKHFGGK